MRIPFIIALTGLLLFSLSASAGTVTVADGKTTWQSTQCVVPTVPPSLVDADRHSFASDMNAKAIKYNEYVGLAQAYMDCVSNEAQTDANANSQMIIKSAEDTIAASKENLDRLGAPFKAK